MTRSSRLAMEGLLALALGAVGGGRVRAAPLVDPVAEDDYRVDHFLERMYIGPRFSPKAEVAPFDLFEARIAPHLFYHQPNVDLVTPNAKGYTRGMAFVFTPALRLRMTRSESNPVRTPSFNPQFVTIQHFWAWGMYTDSSGRVDWKHDGAAEADGAGWVKLLAVQYTIAHHSNGQEDCSFNPPQGPCPMPPFATIPEINTRSGNYGTNYEELGVHLKALRLDAGTDTQGYRARTTWSAGLSWERYQGTLIAWVLPGGMDADDPLRSIFGLHRVTATGEYEALVDGRCFSRVRLRLDLTAITGPAGHVWTEPTGRVSFDAAALFKNQGGFGLFTRLFYGQDYYNIRLRDVAPMAIVGFTWESAPLQRFRTLGRVQEGGRPQPVDDSSGTTL